MSLEKNIDRIASALEKIAATLESRPVTTAAAAPVVQAAAEPVVTQAAVAAAPPAQAAVAAAPPAQAAAAPVVQATAAAAPTFTDATPAVQQPTISTAEELNTHLVTEHGRLLATYGEAAFAKIMEVLAGCGYQSVQQIPVAEYNNVLNKVKALV